MRQTVSCKSKIVHLYNHNCSNATNLASLTLFVEQAVVPKDCLCTFLCIEWRKWVMGTPIQCSNTSTKIGRGGRGGDGKATKRREGKMAPGNGAAKCCTLF